MSTCGVKGGHAIQVGVANRAAETKQQDHPMLQTRSLWVPEVLLCPHPHPQLVRFTELSGPAFKTTSRGQHEVTAD